MIMSITGPAVQLADIPAPQSAAQGLHAVAAKLVLIEHYPGRDGQVELTWVEMGEHVGSTAMVVYTECHPTNSVKTVKKNCCSLHSNDI